MPPQGILRSARSRVRSWLLVTDAQVTDTLVTGSLVTDEPAVQSCSAA